MVDAQDQCKAFLAMCNLLDILCSIGKVHVSGDDLDQVAEAMLKGFIAASWQNYCVKKFHWTLHFGDSLREYHNLVPCFCMERKHKQVTALAVKVTNLKFYEKSLYTEVLGEQLHRMGRTSLPVVGLVHASKASKKFVQFVGEVMALPSNAAIHTCSQVYLEGGGKANKGDLILVSSEQSKWDCGHVKAFFEVEMATFCIIQFYHLVSYQAQEHYAKWQSAEDIFIIPINLILAPVTYSVLKECIVTLIPHHLRWFGFEEAKENRAPTWTANCIYQLCVCQSQVCQAVVAHVGSYMWCKHFFHSCVLVKLWEAYLIPKPVLAIAVVLWKLGLGCCPVEAWFGYSCFHASTFANLKMS